jgi:predicted Rossmann fold nucleotide-binding protein DprA/Smf involved in DNA uptake
MSETVLGVTGSRQLVDYHLFDIGIAHWIAQHGVPDRIVSGGATGADKHAERYAAEHDIEMVVHLPLNHLPSPQRYYRRNESIVNDSTHLIAFPSDVQGRDWNNTRGGTQWTMRYAAKQDIPMTILWIQDLQEMIG